MVSIYTLVDPRDGYVYYVGQSINPQKRYHEHYRCDGSGSFAAKGWIMGLKGLRLKPLLFIIEEVDDYRDADRREAHWINFFLAEGEPLVNYLSPSRKQFYCSV